MAQRTCSIDGCDRKHYCRGFCQTHYSRDYRARNLDKERARWAAYYETRWGDERRQRDDAKAARMAATTKTCTACDETKPKTKFYVDRRKSDGLFSWCKRCFLAHCKATQPSTARNERRKQQMLSDPGLPERRREDARRWRQQNPEKFATLNREYQHHRRVAKGGSKVDFAAILAEHGMFCHICWLVIVDLSDLHFDHVTPLAKGGTHTADNIRPAHALCNLRKGDKIA